MKKSTIFTVLLTTLVTLALVSCKKEAETKLKLSHSKKRKTDSGE